MIETIWGWLLAVVVLALLGLLAYYVVFGDDPSVPVPQPWVIELVEKGCRC